MQQKWLLIGALVVAAGASGWFLFNQAPASPSAPAQENPQQSATTAPVATSTISTPSQSQPRPQTAFAFSLVKGDTVSSWSFAGAYTGKSELEQKARSEIERIKTLFENKTTDYNLHISIANQYDLLGDGKQELAYLEKALAIDSINTGLAWANAGNLMVRLGAYKTARMSFEKAAAAQPIEQYHRALLDFLKEHYPNDTAAIQKQQQILSGAPASN